VTLKRFLRRAQNEFGLRFKKIRSDNGTEFKNSQIEGFLEEECIKHEFSSPYTPQQNGVVDRKNRTLLDMARTMLDEYKTLDRFWAEAINTAATPSTSYTFTKSSRKHRMNSLLVKSPMFLILESLGANALFLSREVEVLNLLLKQYKVFY
jgi:transposase InsO family protein